MPHKSDYSIPSDALAQAGASATQGPMLGGGPEMEAFGFTPGQKPTTAQIAGPPRDPGRGGNVGMQAGQFAGIVPGQPSQSTGQMAGALAATKQPTLQNYLAGQFRNDPQAKPKFTDQSSANLSKIDINGMIKDKFKNLKDVSEGERAYRGSMAGAAVGSALHGPVGALMGTSMGALAARAIGAKQSGETEDMTRRQKLGEVLAKMGVSDDKGNIAFDDGASFVLDTIGKQTLKNFGVAPGNRTTRQQHEIDSTNPFANRTMGVVRPVARFIANGIMNHPVDKDPRNQKIVDSITGYLSNAVQKDADSAKTIYSRMNSIVKKMGVKEVDMRNYLESIKGSLDEQELKEMIAGMDKLFAANVN